MGLQARLEAVKAAPLRQHQQLRRLAHLDALIPARAAPHSQLRYPAVPAPRTARPRSPATAWRPSGGRRRPQHAGCGLPQARACPRRARPEWRVRAAHASTAGRSAGPPPPRPVALPPSCSTSLHPRARGPGARRRRRGTTSWLRAPLASPTRTRRQGSSERPRAARRCAPSTPTTRARHRPACQPPRRVRAGCFY